MTLQQKRRPTDPRTPLLRATNTGANISYLSKDTQENFLIVHSDN